LSNAPTIKKATAKAAVKSPPSPSPQRAIKNQPAVVYLRVDGEGIQLSSEEFAAQLQRWMELERDLAFLIGGPDGLAPSCLDLAAPIGAGHIGCAEIHQKFLQAISGEGHYRISQKQCA
jgi:23S rRNA pseudoU1915 N3-methylase RlmH